MVIQYMPGVRVKEGESFENAMKRFKKQCEKAKRLVLKFDERTFPAEFTGGKVDFENTETDNTGHVTLFIPAHIPFNPFGLIVHLEFIDDPARIPPLSMEG